MGLWKRQFVRPTRRVVRPDKPITGSIKVSLKMVEKQRDDLFKTLVELGTHKKLGVAVKQGLNKAMVPIYTATVSRVPVDTGTLKGYFLYFKHRALEKAKRQGRGGAYRSTIVQPERRFVKIPAESKWYYPAHVEYGHGSVAPRSYLREGAEAGRESAIAIFWQHIEKYIDKLWRKRAA